MMQDDSNGDTGFEFVDKKTDGLSIPGDRTAESISSMSSSASLIPSPGVPISSIPGGNLLSSVPPPTELPSFVATSAPAVRPPQYASVPTSQLPPSFVPQSQYSASAPAPTSQIQQYTPPPLQVVTQGAPVLPATTAPLKVVSGDGKDEAFYPTTFSAAIPPSKGIPTQSTTITVNPQATDSASSIFGWMKGAVSSGGILHKVVEKTKSSVDSMITTLDPQMREFIYSGGDMDILVASTKEMKISPIREAFQSIFGKATVSGVSAQSSNIAVQPVGFASGVKAAEERITAVYSNPKLQRPVPVVAVENFLVEIGEDKWYDVGVLILSDPTRQINLQTFTQMTPVPLPIVTLAQEETPSDYPLRWSGLAVTIGSLMANNLQVSHTEWHYALTGVARRDMILMAAKSLAGMYKTALHQAQ